MNLNFPGSSSILILYHGQNYLTRVIIPFHRAKSGGLPRLANMELPRYWKGAVFIPFQKFLGESSGQEGILIKRLGM